MFTNAEKHGLPSVNFHLWQPCNMRCRFCFATFLDVKQSCLPKGHLSEAEAVGVVDALCQAGANKITFAGGEPTLCPWLPELMAVAKAHNVTTMLVTNGSRIEEDWLTKHGSLIDWITISVDSLDPGTNLISGRNMRGSILPPDSDWYLEKVRLVRNAGIRLKINTVVHKLNVHENMAPFISLSQPERWKVFQVLPVQGQNDGKVEDLLIAGVEFEAFIQKHQKLLPNQVIIPESNDVMTGSYLMVDPAGRFYDNVDGEHKYSTSITEVGVDEALKEVRFSQDKFVERSGLYDWR